MNILVEKKYLIVKVENIEEKDPLPGYPAYPASEDIYSQCKEESEINPEEIEKKKNIESRLFFMTLTGNVVGRCKHPDNHNNPYSPPNESHSSKIIVVEHNALMLDVNTNLFILSLRVWW